MSDSTPQANVAHNAQAFYSFGKYQKALDCLHELAIQMGERDDPRVQFNLILAEHARNGFKEPLTLRNQVAAIRNSLKERSARTAKVKDSLSLEDDTEQNDDTDTDTSILLYNLAALDFHEKRYRASREILHSLFARIEVLDESLGVHVCFLLLDVLLHSVRGNVYTASDRERFVQEAAPLLNYLERPHNIGPPLPVPNENEGHISNSVERKDDDGVADSDEKRAGRNLEQIEFTFRLHLYKAKVRLLQGQVKLAKRELKDALEIFSSELRPPHVAASLPGKQAGGGDSDDEETAVAVNSAPHMTMAPSDPYLPPASVANVAALYLKANLEYLRQNYRKAFKLLTSCQRGEGNRGPTPLYYNDMGCLHSKMGLHAISIQYFQKALSCFQNTPGPGRSPLEPDGRVTPHVICEVMYNTGAQLLLLGKYPEAFRSFENASLLLYNRPRLWLRMAECCVSQHRLEQIKYAQIRDRLLTRVMGKGKHRRVLLPVSNDPRTDPLTGKGQGDKSGIKSAEEKERGRLRGSCTMLYAVKCLKNVLFLLSIASQGMGRSRLHVSSLLGAKAVKDGEAGADSTGDAEAEVGGENGVVGAGLEGGQEEGLMEQVALLNLSYVYLCLHEPILALRHAEEVLARPGVSPSKQVIAHTYASEALCALDRAPEAVQHLAPGGHGLSEDAAAAALPEQRQKDSQQVTSDSFLPAEHFAARARSNLHLNLATAYLLQGNMSVAEKCVRVGLAACPTSSDALRALVFILLKKGQNSAALEVLKSRRPAGESE